jgi:hypothetical protein
MTLNINKMLQKLIYSIFFCLQFFFTFLRLFFKKLELFLDEPAMILRYTKHKCLQLPWTREGLSKFVLRRSRAFPVARSQRD